MSAILFEILGVKSVIEFDATMSEMHRSSADPTEHPIEAGANITDHVRPKLDTVSLDACITNTPLNDVSISHFAEYKRVASLAGGKAFLPLQIKGSKQLTQAGIKGPFVSPVAVPGGYRPTTPPVWTGATWTQDVPQTINSNPIQFPSYKDRPKEVYEYLRTIVSSGLEVILVTDLRTYPSMVIRSLGTPRKAEEAIFFSLELQEMRRVYTSTVSVKVKRVVAEARAEDVAKEGPKVVYAESLEEAEETESLLSRGTGINTRD